jgi:guanosine-3',5'-bis(diphosphate) 3'-pyrophosphohydrolase
VNGRPPSAGASGGDLITHPVTVATIMVPLGADDQTLCAAMLHDTIEDTPYTLGALRRGFGAGVSAMVTELMALGHITGHPAAASTMRAMRSADARVVAMTLADRLHYMQGLPFLPREKQLRKAREVLDFFVPVARQLNADLTPMASSRLSTLQARTSRRCW